MHPHPSLLPFLPQLLENLPLESEIHRALISPGRVALIRRYEVVREAGELGPSVLLVAGPAEQGAPPSSSARPVAARSTAAFGIAGAGGVGVVTAAGVVAEMAAGAVVRLA